MTSTVRPHLSFDAFVALHPGTPEPYGLDSVRLPCPGCAATSYVITFVSDDEGFNASCSADLGGKPRSVHLSAGCARSTVARALGMADETYAQALKGVAPFDHDGIDWTSVGVVEDLDRARLVLRHVRATGRDVAYLPEAPGSGWFTWDGTVWAPVLSVGSLVHEVAYELSDAASALFEAARTETDEDRSKALQARASLALKASREARRGSWIDQTTRVLRDLPGVVMSLNDFDADPNLLQAANGVIDLRTGEIRSPRKEDRITRRLTVNYRPEATAPAWDTFLSDVFITEAGESDHDVVDYIRRLIGYGVTGHTREQCFAVLHGKGGNGKGVFANVLSRVFAPVKATTPFATFEERAKGSIPNDIAALRDARLVFASEGEAGRPMAESVIKSVTGSDPISARFMRAEFFTFQPQFLILLATNNRPAFRGQDEGLWRRVKLIAFRQQFTYDKGNRDDTLEGRLMDQAEGVLAWAVRGAVEWAEHGLAEPDSITSATKTYRRESDRLGDFISERLTVTGEHLDVVTLTELFAAYRDWAADELEDRPMGRRAFSEAISERPVIQRAIRSGRPIYRHVKVKTTAQRTAEEQQAIRDARPVALLTEDTA